MKDHPSFAAFPSFSLPKPKIRTKLIHGTQAQELLVGNDILRKRICYLIRATKCCVIRVEKWDSVKNQQISQGCVTWEGVTEIKGPGWVNGDLDETSSTSRELAGRRIHQPGRITLGGREIWYFTLPTNLKWRPRTFSRFLSDILFTETADLPSHLFSIFDRLRVRAFALTN